MTEPLNNDRLAEIRAGLDGVTPGPWYSDSVYTEGSYGSGEDTTEGFKSYVIRTEAQKSYGEDAVVCDALNSGTAEVHEEFDEDGVTAWDEPGRRNMAHIARLDPQTVSALLARLDKAEAGWQPIETAPKNRVILAVRMEWWTPTNGDHRWVYSRVRETSWLDGSQRWDFGGEKQPTHWKPLDLPPPPSSES